MSQVTHRLRPKGSDKWQHVTAEQLQLITKQVGPRTLKANYQVEAMDEKPAKLATTDETDPKKDQPASAGAPK
jgi:hypothetical protein